MVDVFSGTDAEWNETEAAETTFQEDEASDDTSYPGQSSRAVL